MSMPAEILNFNDTVYVRNINEKVSINTIKSELSKLFEKYGPIQSITVHKNLRMRGQAFVALEDEEHAKKAIDDLNGASLFDKKLELHFAKSSSNASVQNKLVEKEYESYLEQRKRVKEELNKEREKAPVIKKQKIINEQLPPNKIILLRDLPDGTTQDELNEIFGKFGGFVEVRLVAVKHVAFVEYEKDNDAIAVKESLSTLELKGHKIIGNYAKK